MFDCVQGSEREKTIGTVVSIVVGFISTGILVISQTLGASIETSVLITNILGNFIGYTGDVVVAKQCFDEWDGENYIPVNFDQWDIRRRFLWYLKSLISKSFIRFILTVVIDTMVSLAIIDLVTKLLDDLKIVFRFRNSLIAGVVSILTFQVFVNEIRFNYAYTRATDFTNDLIVYMWASILLILYILLKKLNMLSPKK